jgi:predicted HTH transcriptional regulator
MPRNRELMRVFKDVGLVEQLGSGMSRILKAYDKSIFDISEHFIKVVFPFDEELSAAKSATDATKSATNQLTEDEKKVIQAIRENPEITQKQLTQTTGITIGTIKRILPRLQEKGKIERRGSRRSGKWHIIE